LRPSLANDRREYGISEPSPIFRIRDDRTMTDPDQNGNRRPAIAGLAIAVVLLAVGLWLAHDLTAASKLQDCLMSGRTNCAVIPAQ
jgi:hypothetical protein